VGNRKKIKMWGSWSASLILITKMETNSGKVIFSASEDFAEPFSRLLNKFGNFTLSMYLKKRLVP